MRESKDPGVEQKRNGEETRHPCFVKLSQELPWAEIAGRKEGFAQHKRGA